MTSKDKEQESKALAGLALGRIVRYVRPEDSTHRAAIVVGTGDGTGQDAVLLVFGLPNESLSYVTAAAYDTEKAVGTWHWNQNQ